MAKGGDFEREMCKKLSLWWSEGLRDDIFYRTAASGARATARRKRGRDTAFHFGDMTFADPSGEPLVRAWSTEYKTGYAEKSKRKSGTTRVTNWCALDLLDSNQKEPTLVKMWNQCLTDALHSNRQPVLIFRRLAMQACIAIWSTYMSHLESYFGRCPYPTLTIKTEDVKITVIALSAFFRWIPDIRPALPTQTDRAPNTPRRRLI